MRVVHKYLAYLFFPLLMLLASAGLSGAQYCFDLCADYDSYWCTNGAFVFGCDYFPSCYQQAGTFYCNYNCYDTGQETDDCPAGEKCLCVNKVLCPLCEVSGKDLSVCNDDVGCNVGDTGPPTITIEYPFTGSTYASSVYPINLSGTASDDTGVVQVEWVNSRIDGFVRGSGTASGTTSWQTGLINLEPGDNLITVTASDAAENEASDSITVTYSPPSDYGLPVITVSEGTSDYQVSISDPDTLNEVAWAWGVKPSVYFLLPFANDDSPVLSADEKDRLRNFIEGLGSEWDRITESKHPLDMYFVEPFVIPGYSSSDNDWYQYITQSISYFESTYPGYLNDPHIYVFLYPEAYFTSTYYLKTGSSDNTKIGEIYVSRFQYGLDPEIMRNIMLHEIAHEFIEFPNDINIPPGDSMYFWGQHPASFRQEGGVCDENTSLGGCIHNAYWQSPTGTEGYYEPYSIMSVPRIQATELGAGRGLSMSAFDAMALGVRSKYEDGGYMFYEGTYQDNPGGWTFTPGQAHDYGISSRRILEYQTVESEDTSFWDIRFDTPKNQLSPSTTSFSVSKTGQDGRALFVYASDSLNPGHFKVFNTSSYTETAVIDASAPSSPPNLQAQAVSFDRIDLSWSPSSDNVYVSGYHVYRDDSPLDDVSGTSYSDTGLQEITMYEYTVSAYDAAGNEGPGSVATATTQSVCNNDGSCTGAENCGNCPGDCSCAGEEICCQDACTPPPACPDCNDGDSCTSDVCIGQGTCSPGCSNVPITSCISLDGCCPAGCDHASDSDCVADITAVFGDVPGSDYTGTIEDTFTSLDYDIHDGEQTLLTWSWSVFRPYPVSKTIILKANLASIPSWSEIQDAKLYLYQVSDYGNSQTTNTIHKIINKNAVISEVNGYYASSTVEWTDVPLGTTYHNVPLGLADIDPPEDTVYLYTSNGYKPFSITNMVQDWVNDPGSNYGLLISGESGVSDETGRTFAATENVDPGRRPMIEITYTPPTYHQADLDHSCGISDTEVVVYIANWYMDSRAYTMKRLMEAIEFYNTGANSCT